MLEHKLTLRGVAAARHGQPGRRCISAHLLGRSGPGWLFGQSTKTLMLDLRPSTSPPSDAGPTAKEQDEWKKFR